MLIKQNIKKFNFNMKKIFELMCFEIFNLFADLNKFEFVYFKRNLFECL